MAEERQYGVESTFQFPLVVYGGTDFTTSALTFAAGDILLIRDASTGINLANTTSVARIGTLGVFSAVVTASEMQMAKGVLVLRDQTSTKLWEDQAILIETYGSTAALVAWDKNSSAPNVNTESMTAGAITSTAFAAGAINSTAIAASAITANKIATAAITSTKIGPDAITSTQIGTGAITAGKLAADAISTANVADGVFTTIWAESTRSITVVLAGAVTSTSFAAGAINSTAIAGSAITASKIATAAIESTKFAAGAINSTAVADGALTEGKFAAGALTTGVIASGVFDKVDAGVNSEVLDVLTVDTFSEPHTTTSAPPVSETLHNKVGWLYGILRNRFDASTTAKTFYTSTGGVAFTKAITDTGTYIEQAVTT